ncbi:MAG: hypothetical protein QME75_05090 [Deltaproteobacteria bacterium]|nr:hypothetical protein [Deltaproteobacteria bacterium]
MKSRFPEHLIVAAAEVMGPVTRELTWRTRAALERGETPPLVGALTWADMARWIENAKGKKRGEGNHENLTGSNQEDNQGR